MAGLRSVCAWCKVELAGSVDTDEDSCPITHGVCLPCAQRMLADVAEPLRDFLDRLGVPVLLIDSSPEVRAANALAREILGKDVSEIEGRRPGDVIECLHAYEPGGCGHQVHCKSCTIRRAVLDTYESGKSLIRIRALPDIQSPDDGSKRMCIEISTEKVGDVVLLRVHEFCEAGDTPPGL
ncbi:MAG: hypothetical protein IT364_02145 [Candidatus Hydrogenedentes bacterium]|nr:hypothetical protein [Candidatus Hydrogenedentota bacterium]